MHNFHLQSKQWDLIPTKMERKEKFSSITMEGYRILSTDVRAGYKHFSLHPQIRDFFLFHYEGRLYRFLALQFVWRKSAWWFVHLMKPLVHHMRSKMGMKVLAHIDYFFKIPTVGRRIGREDFLRASADIEEVLSVLGI